MFEIFLFFFSDFSVYNCGSLFARFSAPDLWFIDTNSMVQSCSISVQFYVAWQRGICNFCMNENLVLYLLASCCILKQNFMLLWGLFLGNIQLAELLCNGSADLYYYMACKLLSLTPECFRERGLACILHLVCKLSSVCTKTNHYLFHVDIMYLACYGHVTILALHCGLV